MPERMSLYAELKAGLSQRQEGAVDPATFLVDKTYGPLEMTVAQNVELLIAQIFSGDSIADNMAAVVNNATLMSDLFHTSELLGALAKHSIVDQRAYTDYDQRAADDGGPRRSVRGKYTGYEVHQRTDSGLTTELTVDDFTHSTHPNATARFRTAITVQTGDKMLGGELEITPFGHSISLGQATRSQGESHPMQWKSAYFDTNGNPTEMNKVFGRVSG